MVADVLKVWISWLSDRDDEKRINEMITKKKNFKIIPMYQVHFFPLFRIMGCVQAQDMDSSVSNQSIS